MGAIAIFLSGFKLFWRQKDAAYRLLAIAFVINFTALWIEDGLFTLSVAKSGYQTSDVYGWLAFFSSMFGVFLSAAVGVTWHRNAILGEEARLNSHILAKRELWSYVIQSFLITLVMAIFIGIYALLLIPFMQISSDIISLLIVLIWAIGALFLLALFLRMALILPAAATTSPLNTSQALSATSGQMKSFMLATFLISALVVIAFVALDYVFPHFDQVYFSYKQSLAEITLSALTASAIGMYIVGVLSSLYIHFVYEPLQQARNK